MTGIKKTPLMYQTNLCYSHFLAYMQFLIKKGFLGEKIEDHTGTIYYTTEKGRQFLESIETVLVQVK
jgi:predicted transcriptional regulator